MLIKMIPKTIFNIPNRCLPLICGLFSLIVPFECVQQRNTQDEFSCPEEFGYYPHPTDCTQYYICVFGGALLESCTGGLMYSHDLQTCDWPRNVGCGGSVAASTKNFDKVGAASANLNIDNELTTLSWKHDILESNRERHLYDEENLPLVSELENDRQQRVYRGQPSTLSQVARDRDGGVIRHANALQTLARLEKMKPLAVVSFGSHHQSLRPLSPVPSYIVESPLNSVSTANITVHNATKIEPFYSAYDENPEIYGNIDIGQYKNLRKQHSDQIIQGLHHQKSHLQQISTNSPSYLSQDFADQSEIMMDSQQLDKLTPNKSRNRGSITYTTNGSEYGGGTSSLRWTKPTLRSSASTITKPATEYVDIYKYPPKRPDPVYPTPQADKIAAKCRKDICLLPDCSCGGKDIPGDLNPEDTPQLVLLTFDDSVNELNRGLYADLFEKGRVNPNGCPISATFYISHEWTDYSMVQNLYASGHEIASHSVSHSFGEQFTQRKWMKEIVGQREILSAYGGVRQEDIRGMRAPFLAVGGNKMFKMLYDANFTYDSSMPIYENRPPSWPYTLDYKIFHDCMIPPCPSRSYPGVWEIPMVMWQDLNGGRCSMGDACSNPSTSDGVYKMLIKNFERHFNTNRAPFGLFYHSSWFTQPHHKEGFISFLDTIVNMPEVWLVTNWQVIQWARDPTPISRLNGFSPFNCDYPERSASCHNPKVCNLWHKSGVRYLKTCQPCPDVFPWTGKTGVRNSLVDNDDISIE